ncbi:14968_t:CDS:10 [Cetraspora pellucida]|uniref:14968_t:CDS:1 n=1 Tax=Cetraspora pellucida TaxID=1433469 RepID=A0A9N8ZNJ8_9GLOM|nr:14968_t:CDS:10 [Cetraspora pellucida]
MTIIYEFKYRTTNPLFMLFQQERSVDIVRSLIDIYQNEGYMPDGRSGLENGITQGGSNGDMVVVETYLKKLGMDIIDWELAYEALIKDAEVDPLDRGIYEGRPCSRTIEYSANDYSISLIAKELDKYDDYIKYKKRARNWENLWNPNITFNGAKGFIMPRYQDGKYHNKLDIDGSHFAFYEATSWEYSLDIPFDVKRLIELSGGPKLFEERLDKTFSNKNYQNGYYNIGNEPDFFHICLYHFIGKQYKSVEVIRDILKTKFGSGQDGIPGNDDSGAMGSWFAFNAIGLYPLAGTDIYLINSPHFNRITINLSPQITFTILAYNLTNGSNVNPYVQSVKINGKNWRKTWFRHSNIANGAIMELVMGPEPSKVWGIIGGNEDKIDVEYRVVPPSMNFIVDENDIRTRCVVCCTNTSQAKKRKQEETNNFMGEKENIINFNNVADYIYDSLLEYKNLNDDLERQVHFHLQFDIDLNSIYEHISPVEVTTKDNPYIYVANLAFHNRLKFLENMESKVMPVENLVKDILQHEKRHTLPRTWKDSNENTQYYG